MSDFYDKNIESLKELGFKSINFSGYGATIYENGRLQAKWGEWADIEIIIKTGFYKKEHAVDVGNMMTDDIKENLIKAIDLLKTKPAFTQEDVPVKKPKLKLEVLSEKKRTATKAINCDACGWLKVAMTNEIYSKLTDDEQISVRKAYKNKYKIIKGQQYYEHKTKYAGKKHTAKFLLKIHLICVKYKLYSYLNEGPKADSLGKIIKMNPSIN